MDDEIFKTRENLKLYKLSEEERQEELDKFEKVNLKNKKNKKNKLKYINKNKNILEKKRNDYKNEVKEYFQHGSLIKQEIIPETSKYFIRKRSLDTFINNLKIDLFAMKHNTKIKTHFDLIRSLLSFFSCNISDYINNQFVNTIHIDILNPINDIAIFAKDLMKAKQKKHMNQSIIKYIFKILNVLSSIDIGAVTVYLKSLESKVSKPYKYYELAPILKHIYVPLIILEDVYQNNEIRKCLKEYCNIFPEKRRIAYTLNEMIDVYFNNYKKILHPLLLKDMGGKFYDYWNLPKEFKTKLFKHFNLTKSDIIEPTFEHFKIRHNIKDETVVEELESVEKNGDNLLPNKYYNIIDLLTEFFPAKFLELKGYEKNNKPVELKFDIRELNEFTDIFRYFHCPSDNSSYMLDDRFLYFAKYHPMSQLAVFCAMIIDLFSGLLNINYYSSARIKYESEIYSCVNFFKNILEEVGVLYKYSISKLGDIIRDITLSYKDNHEFVRSSSFESYLDEITIYLKNNFLPCIEFNKTITGLSINDPKYSKFDVKKTLFIEPLYINIKKLKKGINDICMSIDKRKKAADNYVPEKELSTLFRLGSTLSHNSMFNLGFKSLFIKTEFDGSKIITNDQRTVFNYLFFCQKFIDFLDYVINDENSYILRYAHPAILRNQPEKLIRILDEETNDIVIETKSINLTEIIEQRIQNRNELILENIKLKEEIKKSKVHSTTGAYNKEYFLDNFPAIVNEAKKTKNPLSLVIIDIDDFKKLNDSAGHKFGDFVLENIGKILMDIVRKDDIISDYKGEAKNDSLNKFASCFGGDEFVLLLTHTDMENAKKVAQRILDELNGKIYYLINREYQSNLKDKLYNKDISRELYLKLRNTKYKIGASIGIAELHENYSKDDFFEYADTGVYASKMNGKNGFSIYNKENDEYIIHKKINNEWKTKNISFHDVKIWQSNINE